MGYFVVARLSLALLEPADGVAVFWPAAGLASGILIALGPAARWPVVLGVLAATIAANLLGDRNIWSSVFFAVANAGDAVIVAGLIHRFCGSPFKLNELRGVLALFTATAVAASLSGITGTVGFLLFHGSAASPQLIWFHWFSSDVIGIIAVAPLAIGLASFVRNFPPRREIAEGGLALAVVSLVCALLVFLPNEPWTAELAIGSLCPLLLWIASRLRSAFTAVATFIIAITIVWTTTFAVGIFGGLHLSIEERVLAAQATILAITLGALVLAALFSERRRHERRFWRGRPAYRTRCGSAASWPSTGTCLPTKCASARMRPGSSVSTRKEFFLRLNGGNTYIPKTSRGWYPASKVLVRTSPRLRSHSATGGRMVVKSGWKRLRSSSSIGRQTCARQWAHDGCHRAQTF